VFFVTVVCPPVGMPVLLHAHTHSREKDSRSHPSPLEHPLNTKNFLQVHIDKPYTHTHKQAGDPRTEQSFVRRCGECAGSGRRTGVEVQII